jgi:hypothetical protein
MQSKENTKNENKLNYTKVVSNKWRKCVYLDFTTP